MTTRTYAADQAGPLTLDVELTAGQIRVTVEDRPEALVTISTARSTAEDAKTLADATITETPGVLTVRLPKTAGGVTTMTQIGRGGGVTVIQSGGTVYGTVVGAVIGNVVGGSINVSGGDLTISGGNAFIGSPITIDVRLPLGSGLLADTTSADLDTFGPLQNAEATSVSGDVRIDAARTLRARSTSGDVRAALTGNQARVKTVSGDIRLHATAAGATVHARSVSGDIRVTGADVDLDARTVSGRVTTR